MLDRLVTAATDPDQPAVICDNGETLTYGELADRAGRLAGLLRSRGLQIGDAVGLICENTPAYFEMAWACRLAGLYYVAVNTNLGADEVAYILNDSGAVGLLGSDQVPVVAEMNPGLTPKVRLWLLRGEARAGWESYEAAVTAAEPLEIDSAVEGDLLQYSSGTTGRPKGIKRAMRARPGAPGEDMVTFLVGMIGLQQGDTYLCPAPLYHSAPNMWTMTALRMGATVVLMQKFEPSKALALIAKHQVTHGQFVPTMFTRMLKLPQQERMSHDVSSLRGVAHAAAPCPIEIKRSMIDWWGPIVNEYWSSSEGAGFTFISAQEWLDHPGSVGKSLLGPLHICDPEGNELPVGEAGQVWAEGIDFTYINDDGKNAETTSAQGWRSVGDIGRVDEDGYLYLTDRASFMIISGGVNVYPQESENVLIEHPKVYDAAVVGLPNEDLGEMAVAVVQPMDPSQAGPELAAELTSWCQERLARYKCPRQIIFKAELPRSETGKLFKHRLRAELLETGVPS